MRKTKDIWMIDKRFDVSSNREQDCWTKIGIGYENKDGSYDIKLMAVPHSGVMKMSSSQTDKKTDCACKAPIPTCEYCDGSGTVKEVWFDPADPLEGNRG